MTRFLKIYFLLPYYGIKELIPETFFLHINIDFKMCLGSYEFIPTARMSLFLVSFRQLANTQETQREDR